MQEGEDAVSVCVRELGFTYGEHQVLNNVGMVLPDGKLLAVLGPNGVGKTTLFRCILGLEKNFSGTIEIDGDDVNSLSARQMAARIAYIPQVRGNAFGFTVMDMVLMGTSHSMSIMSVPRQKQVEVAEEAMESTGIADLRHRSFVHLSGGEQQLVLIARALAQKAGILVMDEPTSSLDFGNQALVMKKVRRLADDGYTVMMSTHNPQHALWYADLSLAMKDGEVEEFGRVNDVMRPEVMERLYGIKVKFVKDGDSFLISPEVRND